MALQLAITLVLALMMDRRWGEPSCFHPLVGFGALVKWVEHKFYRESYWRGALLVMLVLLTTVASLSLLYYALLLVASDAIALGGHFQAVQVQAIVSTITAAVVVYLAVGWRSLIEHANDVALALQANEIALARQLAAKILSRETGALNETQLSSATIESVLENGNDAIFGAIFWFCLAGVPGVLTYRLANTLDAMWGYKNDRYLKFGWAAARLDDVMNYVPARLAALSYALAGNVNVAMQCWFTQGGHWKSPNAGPVMASGAGSLQLCLGGDAVYHGHLQQRPRLGRGDVAGVGDIQRALNLLKRAIAIWLLCIVLGEAIVYFF